MKKDLKAANRASHKRLFKLAFVIVILAIAAVFIFPNPLRGKLRHWVRQSFSSVISQSPDTNWPVKPDYGHRRRTWLSRERHCRMKARGNDNGIIARLTDCNCLYTWVIDPNSHSTAWCFDTRDRPLCTLVVDRKIDIIAALELVGPGLIIACLVGPLAFDWL